MSIILSILMLTANCEPYQVYAVEYEGNYYEYVADTYDNPNSYIITVDGEKVYVADIVGGENRWQDT